MNVQRIGGHAALGGGILRIANIVMTTLPAPVLAAVYFVTDILLLTGVAALWLSHRTAMGIAGRVGLAVFVLGIVVIRASAFGIRSYPLGAFVVLIGLAIYSVDALVKKYTAVWAPIFWLTALPPALTAGVGGTLSLTVLATVLFGAGFIFTGIELMRSSRKDMLART